MKKKTKEQKTVIRNHGLWPLFWAVISERPESLLVMSWLTGESRLLDK